MSAEPSLGAAQPAGVAQALPPANDAPRIVISMADGEGGTGLAAGPESPQASSPAEMKPVAEPAAPEIQRPPAAMPPSEPSAQQLQPAPDAAPLPEPAPTRADNQSASTLDAIAAFWQQAFGSSDPSESSDLPPHVTSVQQPTEHAQPTTQLRGELAFSASVSPASAKATSEPAPVTAVAPPSKAQADMRDAFDRTNTFAAAEAPAPPAPPKTAESPAPAPAARPEIEHDPAPAAPAIRDVRVQMQSAGGEKAEIRVVEAAGQLRLTVRADQNLSQALRDNLPELKTQFERNDIQAELFRPDAVERADSTAAPNLQTSTSGGGSNHQQAPDGEPGGGHQYQPEWVEQLAQASARQKQTRRFS